ncbi:hypothetical protein NL676_015578 [Syzygium grande]|nr:hypothetical protein NL676_015578 [Syzygium grande]
MIRFLATWLAKDDRQRPYLNRSRSCNSPNLLTTPMQPLQAQGDGEIEKAGGGLGQVWRKSSSMMKVKSTEEVLTLRRPGKRESVATLYSRTCNISYSQRSEHSGAGGLSNTSKLLAGITFATCMKGGHCGFEFATAAIRMGFGSCILKTSHGAMCSTLHLNANSSLKSMEPKWMRATLVSKCWSNLSQISLCPVSELQHIDCQDEDLKKSHFFLQVPSAGYCSVAGGAFQVLDWFIELERWTALDAYTARCEANQFAGE